MPKSAGDGIARGLFATRDMAVGTPSRSIAGRRTLLIIARWGSVVVMLSAALLAFSAATAWPEKTVVVRTPIEAPQQEVHAILLHFEEYGEWNRYLPRVETEGAGSIRVHERGSRPLRHGYRATVVEDDGERRLSWRTRLLGIPGLWETEHSAEVLRLSKEESVFLHRVSHRGWLAIPVSALAESGWIPSMVWMSESLKIRAESTAGTSAHPGSRGRSPL